MRPARRPAFQVNLGQVAGYLIELSLQMRPQNLFSRRLVLAPCSALRGFVLLEMDSSGEMHEIGQA